MSDKDPQTKEAVDNFLKLLEKNIIQIGVEQTERLVFKLLEKKLLESKDDKEKENTLALLDAFNDIFGKSSN